MIKKIMGLAALLLIVGSLGGFLTATDASAAPVQTVMASEVATVAALVDHCGRDDWTRIVPERPLGFNFSENCRQHDICRASYENTHNNALFCHDRFYRDMNATCESAYASWQQPACRLARDVYYKAVVRFDTPA